AKLLVADEIDELVGVRRRMTVIRGEQHESVARRPIGERPREIEVKECGLRRAGARARTVNVGGGVDPGPGGVEIRRSLAPRTRLEELPRLHAERRGPEVPGVVGFRRMHLGHRLSAVDFGLYHIGNRDAYSE